MYTAIEALQHFFSPQSNIICNLKCTFSFSSLSSVMVTFTWSDKDFCCRIDASYFLNCFSNSWLLWMTSFSLVSLSVSSAACSCSRRSWKIKQHLEIVPLQKGVFRVKELNNCLTYTETTRSTICLNQLCPTAARMWPSQIFVRPSLGFCCSKSIPYTDNLSLFL